MSTTSYRIRSIDILRGIIMIIMALDHTRDFFHSTGIAGNPLNPATTTIPLYFTRWITHFCAPTFLFLSGLSAFLSARKKTTAEASVFLIKRGLWLIVVEVVIVSFGISFNIAYNFIMLQVIWAIGWSMLLLGLLVRMPFKVMLVIGLVLFFGHDLAFLYNPPAETAVGLLWRMFLTAAGFIIPIGESRVVGDFYAILPWTGIMILGYCIGKWFEKDFPAERRKRLLITTGLSAITLFIVLRFINVYGDPSPFTRYDTFIQNLFSFLNTSKYPPSLLYSCMTLGPSLIFLALFENARAPWTNVVSIYGKVPFFYYILHFYILHTVLGIVFFATGHTSSQIFTPQSFFFFYLGEDTLRLSVVYVIWISVVISLYFPCRWFANYKATHRQWWLSYV
jgi:uncharacterized membrane protein